MLVRPGYLRRLMGTMRLSACSIIRLLNNPVAARHRGLQNGRRLASNQSSLGPVAPSRYAQAYTRQSGVASERAQVCSQGQHSYSNLQPGVRCWSRAVNSVLAQTFTDLELLIVDDCSADETPDVVARLVNADPRIRSFRHGSQPRYGCETRNTGNCQRPEASTSRSSMTTTNSCRQRSRNRCRFWMQPLLTSVWSTCGSQAHRARSGEDLGTMCRHFRGVRVR